MVIYKTEQVSPEIIKIDSSAGLAFFIRTSYLKHINPIDIVENAGFDEEQSEEIIDAGMCYSAELKAFSYLARCEQYRSGLARKLLNKKFQKKYIDCALDFLEEKGFLDDFRWGTFWLNSRKINHLEGRTKLLAELLSRGIDRAVALNILDEYFKENDEMQLCIQAYKKYLFRIKSEKNESEKIVKYLLSQGFSMKMIKKALSETSLED